MDQILTEKKPSLKAQIAYVKDARELLEGGSATIIMGEEQVGMLRAIEENLCAVKLMDMEVNNG